MKLYRCAGGVVGTYASIVSVWVQKEDETNYYHWLSRKGEIIKF